LHRDRNEYQPRSLWLAGIKRIQVRNSESTAGSGVNECSGVNAVEEAEDRANRETAADQQG